VQGFGWRARRKETTRKAKTQVWDNIKMNLREIGWGGMDWYGALVNTVMNLRIPSNVGKFLSS
jgi:hypothetical protein